MAAFMRGFKSPNSNVTKGHKSGTMSDFKPANPKTPMSSKPPQSSLVPNMSGPVRPGKGSLKGVK